MGTPPVSQAETERRWPMGCRRRRGLRLGQGDQRAPHPRGNSTVPVVWPKELGKLAATVHGKVARWVIAGEAFMATTRWVEVLGSISDTVRCSCTRKEGGRWSGEEVSTEHSFSGEHVRAPVSNLRGQWHYHGKPMRARKARGGDHARIKMEVPAVSWGGRNGQLRWGACAGSGGGEREHVLCCCWSGGRK
jgi:hypothetical protein